MATDGPDDTSRDELERIRYSGLALVTTLKTRLGKIAQLLETGQASDALALLQVEMKRLQDAADALAAAPADDANPGGRPEGP